MLSKLKELLIESKKIDIPVYFIPEQFDNGCFVTKYEKSSVMAEDICIKLYSVPIISRSNKWMTRLIFYPTSDVEKYQLLRLHEIVVNYTNYGKSMM